MSRIIRMPEVLANTAEASIQTWLVKLGDEIAVGSPLAEVETEKAVVEYAAETEGTVLQLLVGEGETIAVGDPIAVVGAAGEDPGEAPGAAGGAEATTSGTSDEAPEPETAAEVGPAPLDDAPTELGSTDDAPAGASGENGGRAFVSPIVRRLAKERGLDLAGVAGTGPGGRIVRRDIDGLEAGAAAAASAAGATAAAGVPAAMAAAAVPEGAEAEAAAATAPAVSVGSSSEAAPAASAPAITAASPAPAAPATAAPTAAAPAAPAAGAASGAVGRAGDAPFTDIPHTGMRRAIARRLTESKSTVPHFYLVADCRVDALFELRKRVNETSPVKVSVNDFVLKAAAAAFVDVPEANATWGETAIRRYSTVDMSVAISIDGGLVTPVLRSVERMPLTEVTRTVVELAERARAGRLKQHELEGGSFAVSNLGMFGTAEFSAIINPPQSAILAVGQARPQPIVVDGELAVGTVMTVTMSADHRVLDGALAAQWLAAFVKRVENPLSILI